MLRTGLWLLLAASSGVSAFVSHATAPTVRRMCSLMPPPPDTGFDPAHLVRAAKVIVLARADSASRTGRLPDGRTYSVVHFTVSETIDSGGWHVPATLRIPGSVTTVPDFNPEPVPYHWVRPAGLRGSCVAMSYQQGALFLLLLRGAAVDSLDPYWAALSPTNEQVRGRDDPWVTWVRRARQR